MDRFIAYLDVRLELSVDLDGPALVGLLLIDDELVFLIGQLSMRKTSPLMRLVRAIFTVRYRHLHSVVSQYHYVQNCAPKDVCNTQNRQYLFSWGL